MVVGWLIVQMHATEGAAFLGVEPRERELFCAKLTALHSLDSGAEGRLPMWMLRPAPGCLSHLTS